MISCNYNGWADLPEDEREGMEEFEATRPLSDSAALIGLPRGTDQAGPRQLTNNPLRQRKAA